MMIDGVDVMTTSPTRRSPLLVFAILAVLLACGFTITGEGLRWFWVDIPWLGALLAVVGVLIGVLYFMRRARARS